MDASRKLSGEYDPLFGGKAGKPSGRAPVNRISTISQPIVTRDKTGRRVSGTYGTDKPDTKPQNPNGHQQSDYMRQWEAASKHRTAQQLLEIKRAEARQNSPRPAKMTTSARRKRLASLEANQ